jgi:hypothetical protein
VADGYDAIAERYAAWAASFESPTMRWVEKLLALIEDGSRHRVHGRASTWSRRR